VIAARSLAGAGLLGIAYLAAGCKVDQAAFDNRVFACDPSAKDPGCGTDASGKAMVCYAASLLDGTDFCAADCGETPMSLPDGNVCVEGKAKLKFCDPSGMDATATCGQSALGCLRTDVTSEEGICTTMIPCTEDKDCKDPVRSTCAATFLTQLYSKNTTLEADHLYCLQKNCQSGASSCSPGQSCLPLLVPAAAHPPDICVPNCDSGQDCPPNSVCFQRISGPANPAICIPGLLGFICETDINCLVGKCLSDEDPDADHGLKLCTINCNSDADCAVFDSNQGTFACVVRNGQGHCESPYSYRGNSCRTSADCMRDENTICVFQSPPEKPTDLGTCLRPCTVAPGQTAPDCAPRAGIGHTCLPFLTVSDPTSAPTATAACFPGSFAVPCRTTANCVGDLTCRGADPTAGKLGSCTTLCATNSDPHDPDADCHNDRWIGDPSYCATPPNATTGLCAPLLAGGSPCQSDNQCQTKVCQPPPDGGTSTSAKCAMATP
jgi:hypothetical protein